MNHRLANTPDPTQGDAPLVLQPNEVFIFGANQLGEHDGGSAAAATKFYGAVRGEIHRTGRSYGLITILFPDPANGIAYGRPSKKFLAEEFSNLYYQCNLEKEKTFYLTKVGIGISGWALKEVVQCMIISGTNIPTNLVLPIEFEEELVNSDERKYATIPVEDQLDFLMEIHMRCNFLYSRGKYTALWAYLNTFVRKDANVNELKSIEIACRNLRDHESFKSVLNALKEDFANKI